MQDIWLSLAWKEWQEHKWKMVSMTAVVVGIAFGALLTGLGDSLSDSVQISLYLAGVPMAIFVGLGIAAGEQSRRTLPFLQSLPVPMWRVAVVKLAAAILTLLLAIGLAALFFAAARFVLPYLHLRVKAITGSREPSSENFWITFWSQWTTTIAAVMAISLALWSAAWGVNRRDEVSAGAVALIVMIGWWVMLLFAWQIFVGGEFTRQTARLFAVGVGSAPLGFLFLPNIAPEHPIAAWYGLWFFLVGQGVLAVRFAMKFGQTSGREVRSPRAVAATRGVRDFLPQPRRFAWTAIAWKQLRESGPVALAGLAAVAAIVLVVLVVWLAESTGSGGYREIAIFFGRALITFGFIIALVAGISVSLNDAGSRLGGFWRSRPIQPDLWFVVKFIVGLAVVMGAIYVPIGLMSLGGIPFTDIMNGTDAKWVTPAIHVTTFAAAVMMTCLVRQAVYSAILSIAVVYGGLFVSHAVWMASNYLGFTNVPTNYLGRLGDISGNLSSLPLATGFIGTFVVCVIVGWLAMRNDWGRAAR